MTEHISNGLSAQRLTGAVWRKSRHSGAVGNCVELASIGGGDIAVRNSRNPQGPALIYTRDDMTAFVAGVKDGEFDGILD